MRWVGSGRKRTASADKIAPLALPMPGATALAKVPSSRSMSSMAAPIAPRAAPVDRPWTTRADSSAGTPVAVAKITSEPACTAIAVSSTGRRPTWSDSLPRVSRAASTAIAYTPNTTVVVIGVKCHWAW